MRAFLSAFLLELRAFSRSRALIVFCAFSASWPFAVRSLLSGAAGGGVETIVLYSLGSVFAVATVALSASAAGSFAKDRERGRLALSTVRPASRATLALGRIAALSACGAAALAAACAATAAATGGCPRQCSHVFRPAMPDAAAEALRLYDEYAKNDPAFAVNAEKAGKREVLRYLARYAAERYETIPPSAKAHWDFPDVPLDAGRLAVRMNQNDTFGRVEGSEGIFYFRGLEARLADGRSGDAIFPLAAKERVGDAPETANKDMPASCGAVTLHFENTGRKGITLNPRTGLAVLSDAGGLAFNLLRCWLVMAATLATAVSACVFLGACLGRGVAVFAAVSLLLSGAAAPAILDEAPDPFEASGADRLSLRVTEFARAATAPLDAFSPAAQAAAGECVEWRDAAKAAFAGFLLHPLLFSLLCAIILPRAPLPRH